jgi:hypothetical protein
LIYSNKQGEIKLFLNGFIPLLNFSLDSLISYQQMAYFVTDIDLSENFDYLTIISEEQEISGLGNHVTLNQKFINMEILRGLNSTIVVKIASLVC